MRFREAELPGVWIVDLEPKEDARGFFARTFCAREFGEHKLCTTWVQCSVSYNRRKGTLRGLHFQRSPADETKLVRCTKGSLYDVVLDLRRDSRTFLKWTGIELSEGNRRAVY